MTIEPDVVLTGSGDQTVRITFAASDDLSGTRTLAVFIHTSANSNFGTPNPELVSGDKLNGLWVMEFQIPQFAPTGIWRIRELQLHDEIGNFRQILDGSEFGSGSFETFQKLGFTNTFVVG